MQHGQKNWWMNGWFLPAFSVALGIVASVAFWVGGNSGEGAFAFGLMTVFGALLLVGGREMMRAFRATGATNAGR